MTNEEQKQHLLSPDEEAYEHKNDTAEYRISRVRHVLSWAVLASLIISLGVNTIFLYFYRHPGKTCSTHNVGLEQEVRDMQRWRYTAYSHPNETIRNAAWGNLDIDRTIIALDHVEAVELGLPPSTVFPWDNDKDIYAVSAFHQLHCLKLLYGALQEAHHGKPFSNQYPHIMHCLDSLRGDIECMADDHLLAVGPGFNPPIKEGQFMHCRDFSKLDNWARDHHSCFKYNYVNDDMPPTEMHQWQNCPESSQYTPKVRNYFGYDDEWVPEFVANHGPEFPEGIDDRVEG